MARPTTLVDGRMTPPGSVPAVVLLDLPVAELDHIEQSWRPARESAAAVLVLEHAHWDWRRKREPVEAHRLRLIAVQAGGDYQGVMAVRVTSRPARCGPPGEPVLYVEYLEAAPWNLKGLAEPPRYLGVGSRLIAEAVRISRDNGWKGRVGLHALPQAERFYQAVCGMTRVGPDPDYYDLTYFEYSGVQADARAAASE